jgi:phosphate transport system protein
VTDDSGKEKANQMRQLEGHTVQRFDDELSHLHMLLVEMGSLVLDQSRTALHALEEEDLEAARRVLEREMQVNDLEVRIDDELVDVMARRGPVARDLRAVVSFSKLVTDLERAGDNARRVAQAALNIYETRRSVPSAKLLRDVGSMGRLALGMLEEGIEIFDTLDLQRAEALVINHHALDDELQSGLRRLSTFVLEDARLIGYAISITLVLRALERIGDHGRNIAEFVVYMLRGADVRHQLRRSAEGGVGEQGAAASP